MALMSDPEPTVGSRWYTDTTTWGRLSGEVIGLSVHFRYDDGSEAVYEPEEFADFHPEEERR